MPANTVEAVLDCLVAKLQASAYASGFGKIAKWEGRYGDEEEFKNIFTVKPACLFAWLGDDLEEVTPGATYVKVMRVSALVAAKNYGKLLDAMTAAHGMADKVEEVLHNANLTLADFISALQVRRAPIINHKELAVVGIDFEIRFAN